MTTMTPTISINDIKAGRLAPTAIESAGVTGVHWADTGATECRSHLLDPSWAAQSVESSDEPLGVALYGDVECDLCKEAR